MLLESSPHPLGALLCALYVLVTPAICRTTGAATATLPFEPLFTKPPTFVYTFDSNTTEEIIASEGIQPGQPDPKPRVSWAYWLSYADTDAVLDPNALAQTEVGFMFAGRNLTLPNPSGAYNGCEGALGETCAKGLVDAFKEKVSEGRTLFSASLNFKSQFDVPSPANLSCPWDIFKDFLVASSSMQEPTVASENVKTTYLVPGGNASSPMVSDTIYNVTAQRELNKIVVGVMARIPISLGTRKDVKNIQMELVCLKAVVVDPERDQPTASVSGSEAPATASSTGSSALSTPTNAASGLVPNTGFAGISFQGILGLLLVFV